MLRELAGPVTYAKYLRAKQGSWHAEAPAASSVPTQSMRPLLSVVWSLRNLAGGRTGTLKVINGKPTMVDFPVPASQIAEERYLKDWYESLVTALKS